MLIGEISKTMDIKYLALDPATDCAELKLGIAIVIVCPCLPGFFGVIGLAVGMVMPMEQC